MHEGGDGLDFCARGAGADNRIRLDGHADWPKPAARRGRGEPHATSGLRSLARQHLWRPTSSAIEIANLGIFKVKIAEVALTVAKRAQLDFDARQVRMG
jgi:hypothetical protein